MDNKIAQEKLQRIATLKKDYFTWLKYYFPQCATKKSAVHKKFVDNLLNKKISS